MKFIYSFLFLLLSVVGYSQTTRPSTLPSPNSPSGYGLIGYSRADSGFIWGRRDTFPARFPTTIWHPNGNFYKTTGSGAAWTLLIPSTAGTVTNVMANNPISVTNSTTTPIISLDTTFSASGVTARGRTKQQIDSLGAAIGNGFVTLTTNQTISGGKTFSAITNFSNTTSSNSSNNGALIVGGGIGVGSDSYISGVRVGVGAGTNSSNTLFGLGGINSNTAGSRLSAFGERALSSNTTGIDNTGLGWYSLDATNTGSSNTGVGSGALGNNTTGSNNVGVGVGAGEFITGFSPNSTGSNSIFVGNNAKAAANGQTNQIVIGHDATGNGSNTVTIGNSSVVDNYFTGNIRGGALILTGNASGSEANFGFFNTPTPANSVSAAFTNNSTTFESLQVKNNGSGKIATFRNSGGVVAEFGNDGKIGVGTTVSAAFMANVRGALPSLFTATSAATTATYGGSVFARETGTNGDGNGLAISMYDNATTMSEYGYIGAIIESNTASSHSGAIILAPSSSGSRTERFRVGSGGNVTALGVYNATVGGTNRDVFVDNTGLIGYVSSFRASKKNIKPLYATDWIHKLNPVTFNYRVKDSLGKYTDSAYKELEYGLVAEEVESVNKEMVFYDVDSTGKQKLRGVHYSKLIIPLLAEVQEHKKRIDAQDKIIEALLTRIKALESKLN